MDDNQLITTVAVALLFLWLKGQVCIALFRSYQLYTSWRLRYWKIFNSTLLMFPLHVHTKTYWEVERVPQSSHWRSVRTCIAVHLPLSLRRTVSVPAVARRRRAALPAGARPQSAALPAAARRQTRKARAAHPPTTCRCRRYRLYLSRKLKNNATSREITLHVTLSWGSEHCAHGHHVRSYLRLQWTASPCPPPSAPPPSPAPLAALPVLAAVRLDFPPLHERLGHV